MSDIETIELPGRVMLPDGDEHDCSVLFGPDDEIKVVVPAPVPPGARLVC